MLLAIDVGNTHTVYGLWDGSSWKAIWRHGTNPRETEDELAVWLHGAHAMAGLDMAVDAFIVASVVPSVDIHLKRLAAKHFQAPIRFLKRGDEVGVKVDYDPPHAVGADRLANALSALKRIEPPIIVVDFGTATTFDTIDRDGVYVGGSIMPGVGTSTNALVEKAAKLPQFDLVAPETAIGKNVTHSLQAGIMLGYAGAVDAVARQINEELGGDATILSTGGLGSLFQGLCRLVTRHEPTLTLDGLVIAHELLNR